MNVVWTVLGGVVTVLLVLFVLVMLLMPTVLAVFPGVP